MAGAPRLPQEVCDIVVAELIDSCDSGEAWRDALLACSLVCRAWRARWQPELSRHVRLSVPLPNYSDPNPWSIYRPYGMELVYPAFFALLSHHPHLLPSIREIEMEDPSGDSIATIASLVPDLRAISIVLLKHRATRRVGLDRLLGRFIALQSLTLSISVSKTTDFALIVNALSSVRAIHFDWIAIRTPEPCDLAPPPRFAHTMAIKFTQDFNDFLSTDSTLLPWLASSEQLVTVSLDLWGGPDGAERSLHGLAALHTIRHLCSRYFTLEGEDDAHSNTVRSSQAPSESSGPTVPNDAVHVLSSLLKQLPSLRTLSLLFSDGARLLNVMPSVAALVLANGDCAPMLEKLEFEIVLDEHNETSLVCQRVLGIFSKYITSLLKGRSSAVLREVSIVVNFEEVEEQSPRLFQQALNSMITSQHERSSSDMSSSLLLPLVVELYDKAVQVSAEAPFAILESASPST